jgi:hypothetical protein
LEEETSIQISSRKNSRKGAVWKTEEDNIKTDFEGLCSVDGKGIEWTQVVSNGGRWY